MMIMISVMSQVGNKVISKPKGIPVSGGGGRVGWVRKGMEGVSQPLDELNDVTFTVKMLLVNLLELNSCNDNNLARFRLD